MQHHIIILVRNIAEKLLFIHVRIREQRQSLITVAGENDLVKDFVAGCARDRNALLQPLNPPHWRLQTHFSLQPRQELIDIATRTTGNHIPLWPVGDGQQAMIIKESNKELGRKGLHLLIAARPYGATHRQNIVITETLTVAAAAQIFSQRQLPFFAV